MLAGQVRLRHRVAAARDWLSIGSFARVHQDDASMASDLTKSIGNALLECTAVDRTFTVSAPIGNAGVSGVRTLHSVSHQLWIRSVRSPAVRGPVRNRGKESTGSRRGDVAPRIASLARGRRTDGEIASQVALPL